MEKNMYMRLASLANVEAEFKLNCHSPASQHTGLSSFSRFKGLAVFMRVGDDRYSSAEGAHREGRGTYVMEVCVGKHIRPLFEAYGAYDKISGDTGSTQWSSMRGHALMPSSIVDVPWTYELWTPHDGSRTQAQST